jgi:hypothetical protein
MARFMLATRVSHYPLILEEQEYGSGDLSPVVSKVAINEVGRNVLG